MGRRLLVFVALPYANGALHLGQIAGAYLPYDAFRRFAKLRGYELISVSGSDEHGTAITLEAKREGTNPDKTAKKFHEVNSDIFRQMDIDFDAYIETSSDLHKEIVQDFVRTLDEKGFIEKGKMVQPFCPTENIFLPDRYVRGTCPYCGYESATGDQCDSCGKTLEPSELLNPECTFDGSTPVFKETEHLFFKLSILQDQLLGYINSRHSWRMNVMNYSKNFISDGLKDRPITRDLSWGVKVPFSGFEDKRIYVWFEALIGYLTGTAKYLGSREKASEIWSDEGLDHYYFMGKDNIAFHSIIWPGMLIAHGQYTLPTFVVANEYLNFHGEKFSKSRGVGIRMPEMLENYNSEFIRFGVFYNLPEEHDSDFSIEDFQNKINTELIDKFGNFVNRALLMSFKKGPITQDQISQNEIDAEAERYLDETITKIIDNMDKVNILKAFRNWLDLARYSNNYITRRKPWEQCKKDDANCNASIYTAMKIAFTLAVTGQIFLPRTSKKVLKWLGYDSPVTLTGNLSYPVAKVIEKPERLFEKIRDKEINLRIVVAKIDEVLDHPNAQRLYVLNVDLGEEKRTIVSGIKEHYSKENLIGKKIALVSNLRPAKIRGVESNGMLLATEDQDGKIHLVLVPDEVPTGEIIKLGDNKIGSKQISIDDFGKFEIKTFLHNDKMVPAISIGNTTAPLLAIDKELDIDGDVKEGLKIR